MDLKNNSIKMAHILANPEAKAILVREFPEFSNPFMLKVSAHMTLEQVLGLAKGKIPQKKIEDVVNKLKAL